MRFWFLFFYVLTSGDQFTPNCCKWNGHGVCGSFECCPLGGEPILKYNNGVWNCTCKELQQCAQTPTFRPTFHGVESPTGPTPPWAPSSRFPTTQFPTFTPRTFRPTTHQPSNQPTTKSPTYVLTIIQNTTNQSLVQLVLLWSAFGLAIFSNLCLCFWVIRTRRQQKIEHDYSLIMETVP